MESIVSVISTVGFPIACCIGMGWYINTTMKEFTKAIQNNTIAFEKLISKLTDEEK